MNSREWVVQFPDLTEVLYAEGLRNIKDYKTEFVFYLAARKESYNALDLGFKHVAAMNNWWPSHGGEVRQMSLYWLRNPNKVKPQISAPKSWGARLASYYKNTPCEKHLLQTAASGCGFKIGQVPLKASLYNRFFTLMRLPLVLSEVRRKWLTDHNYRHLDTGSMAQYWINGWDPKVYSGIELEYAHFGITQAQWRKEANF
jgi:hypothetical protein